MFSPLILTKIFEVIELLCIFLFPAFLAISISLTGVLLYISVIIFLALLILRQKKISFFLDYKQIHIAFIFYIFTFTVSKLINTGFDGALHVFCRTLLDYFVFLFVFCFCLHNENTDKNQKLVKIAIFLAAFISIKYGILQFLGFDIFDRLDDKNRLSGFHKNSYTYGGQLIVYFFFLLNSLINGKRKSSLILVLKGLFIIACLFCIFGSYERAVILGVLFGLVAYLILNFKNDKLKRFLVLFLMLFLSLVSSLLFNGKIFARLKNTFLPNKDSSSNVRLRIWKIAISVWKKNILFGVKKFPPLYYFPGITYPPQVLTHAHNVYLQILVTHGLFGLFGYINLLSGMIFTAAKSEKARECLGYIIPVIIAYLVEGIFEYFWGDSEVRYQFLYFTGYILGTFLNSKPAYSPNGSKQ